MQWVPEFVGVSRGGVRKRANAGKLTVFTFIVTEPTKTLLGWEQMKETRRRFDYMSISECEQWSAEIWERISEEEQAEYQRQQARRQHHARKRK